MTARAGVLAMSIVACTHPRPPVNGAALEHVQRWWIVIGHSPVLESLDWRHYARDAQMVVVSGDPRIPIGDFPSATIRLAYLSVGEADARRPYWPAVRDQPFLVEPNPDWPDQHPRRHARPALAGDPAARGGAAADEAGLRRADARHHRHRPLPGEQGPGAVRGLAAGAARLAAPAARARSRARSSSPTAARRWSTRRPFVDGFVVEGVFSIYDAGRRAYRATTDAERTWKLGAIARARASRRDPCSRSNTPTSATSRCHAGPSRNRSATAFAPTSGSAISTPRPARTFPCIFQFFLNI